MGKRRKELSCGPGWADLYPDLLMAIFMKMGTLEVLRGARFVCRSWRKVAEDEPELWRRIHIIRRGLDIDKRVLLELTRFAIDRSKGRLEEFTIDYVGDDLLLEYLCERTSVLTKLCLISCTQISKEAIAKTAKRQPLLEEIQVHHVAFEPVDFDRTEVIRRECPQLKTFKLNYSRLLSDCLQFYIIDPFRDSGALGIGNTMNLLRHLQLIGNRMTNEGLRAILHGCLHLETLDIRQCYNVKMDADMWTLCARLKTIRLPGDSMRDYQFEAYGDWDSNLLVHRTFSVGDQDPSFASKFVFYNI